LSNRFARRDRVLAYLHFDHGHRHFELPYWWYADYVCGYALELLEGFKSEGASVAQIKPPTENAA
jgi:hypothetical protein